MRLTLLPLLIAGLTSMLVSGCNSSPVATTSVESPLPTGVKPTAADSAALKATHPAQSVPFVGKPGLKAALRSGGLAPASTSTR